MNYQHRTALDGIKASLTQLNAMCNDAERKGHSHSPDAMARFISDVAFVGRAIEDSVDIARGTLRLTPDKPQSRFRRWLGYLFPLTRV